MEVKEITGPRLFTITGTEDEMRSLLQVCWSSDRPESNELFNALEDAFPGQPLEGEAGQS